ncbi:hypothetical protein UO65_2588 [Actinokineospora spheciospongiae]|uniref:Uncharacterized protein n=1 Tax=Actinokineospora spheciospongiae TaxID=909613 RepID=W7J7R6_9PSEU|nr:hypothetical protein [Actinokineospora spheciospongiae]EWC62074.1 hypothetical protein UO65_2588 [Actinokineospora spheciospongiae]PWW62144.1 hypothetical protein DFQ13_106398 [Actinokineospora spheciospongiae]
MSEQDAALAALGRAGVVEAIGWAWSAAARRTALDYDPTTGHDQVWLGLTAHKLFCNRLDRVFHCGDFSVAPDEERVGRDVLGAGLLSGELDTMPSLRPGLVERADDHSSPGWRFDRWSWLITSFPFEGVDRISWQSKTPTKQRAAGRRPSADQISLFSLTEDDIDDSVLFVAHAINSDATSSEVHLGRPHTTEGGGRPWTWRVRLEPAPLEPGSGMVRPVVGTRAVPQGVSDAEVQLKRVAGTGE